MSKLQVDSIYAKDALNAPSFPVGATVTGVITATSFSGTVSLPGINTAGFSTFKEMAVSGFGTFKGGVEVTGGEGVKIDSGGLNVTSGLGTFKGDVEFHGNQGVTSVSFDQSDNSLKFVDDAKLKLGTGGDLEIYHSNNNWNYITSPNNRNLSINPVTSEAGIQVYASGAVQLFYDNAKKIETISTGASVYGDLKLQNGLLRENVNIVANKISAAPTINTDNGMMHYFTTQETTTTKPNIISGAGINTDMAIGDTMCLTIITTAAAGGYSFDWRVDGVEASAGVTSSWVGGSAPSAGGSSGLDTYSLTFIKTASARYTMIGNLVNSA